MAYIRRGRVPFFFIQIDLRQVSLISLSLLSPSSSGLPLFGGYTWLGISPPYARRRAAGIGIRIHLLSAALLVRSPEGRRVYCMCIIPRGTTLVVLLHRRGRIARSSSTTFRRGRNPVIGLQGPGGLQASSWICAASGIAGTTTPTTFMRERFPLNGLHTGM